MLNDFQNAKNNYEKAAELNTLLYHGYYDLAQIAMIYDDLKQKLSVQFSEERRRYTEVKQQLIGNLLEEARLWRSKQ